MLIEAIAFTGTLALLALAYSYYQAACRIESRATKAALRGKLSWWQAGA